MRNLKTIGFTLSAALVLGLAGCSEKSGVEEKTKITSPEGTTTITKDTKVESSGKNPPVTVDPAKSPTTTP